VHIVESLKPLEGYAGRLGLTIGNFEGFHRGHLAIIRTLVRECRRRSLVPSVITFTQHPLRVLGKGAPERLSAPEDKLHRLEREGVDLVFLLEFTPSFARMEPLAFLTHLHRCFSPRLYCLGSEFRFGRSNRGTADVLVENAPAFGYDLISVGEVFQDGSPISSTRIRGEVKEGRFEEVRKLLGNCYYVYLTVDSGEGSTRLRLFFDNWAIPRSGSFDGEIEDMDSGRRTHLTLTIGRGGIQVSKKLPPARLYRFYFVKPCVP
jgi:riboflavin kinase/FMN adenylyltransferase